MSQTTGHNFNLDKRAITGSIVDGNGKGNGMVFGQTEIQSSIQNVYRVVAADLAEVETILQTELHRDCPWVTQLLEIDWIRRGKRMRPLLLLLAAGACGRIDNRHWQMAAAVELIHAATLIHDDLIDQAVTRRHQPTVNSQWDNRTTVLLGDFLFTHAFFVGSRSDDPTALRILAESSNRVCEGEIRQNAFGGDLEINELDYFKIIADKTGELCRCSCQIGALLSGANPQQCEAFGQFGLELGTSFQIIDDILDLEGDETEVGKTLGTDLYHGKATLPLIHTLRCLTPPERSAVIEKIRHRQLSIGELKELLHRHHSLHYARSVAHDRIDQALRFTAQMPSNPHLAGLQQLAQFVLNRTH